MIVNYFVAVSKKFELLKRTSVLIYGSNEAAHILLKSIDFFRVIIIGCRASRKYDCSVVTYRKQTHRRTRLNFIQCQLVYSGRGTDYERSRLMSMTKSVPLAHLRNILTSCRTRHSHKTLT